jgi:hypothetical protein
MPKIVYNPVQKQKLQLYPSDTEFVKTETDPLSVHLTGGTMTGGLTVQPGTDVLTALVVNDKDANNVLTVDTINNKVGIGTTAPTGKLDIQGLAVNDLPTYSAEFLAATTWTSTGWTGDWATGWIHATGTVSVLSHDKVAVNATKYQIAYTVTGRNTGSFVIAFGGATSSAITATGAWGPTTASTASLTITPTTDFDGTIVISIKSITGVSTPLVNLKSSDGTARIEMRANTATGNTFIGIGAGRYNTTGYNNTANGFYSLYYNTTGYSNTANGVYSLYSNTTGNYNTANGFYSLYSNTTGFNNTANGYASLYYNTTGYYNTANGVYSLYSNTTGNYNTANGFYSLYSNTTGFNNTANGVNAGRTLITGNSNTFFGYGAGYNASQKTDAVNSMALGNGAFTTADNQVVIGNTSVTQTLLNGNVGIGITAPTAKLHIVGSADTQQLIVKGNATQTSNLAEFQTSAAAVKFSVDVSGNIVAVGDVKGATYHVGATAGIDATIPIAPVLPATIAGSAVFSKGILTSYTPPS